MSISISLIDELVGQSSDNLVDIDIEIIMYEFRELVWMCKMLSINHKKVGSSYMMNLL
jgi:hypothetical protein